MICDSLFFLFMNRDRPTPIPLHNTQYQWMVSDGDSKAFNAVENIHGEEYEVEKVDCVWAASPPQEDI